MPMKRRTKEEKNKYGNHQEETSVVILTDHSLFAFSTADYPPSSLISLLGCH